MNKISVIAMGLGRCKLHFSEYRNKWEMYAQIDKKVNSVYLSKVYVIIMLMDNLC